jgi:hypothetical protein
MVMAIQRSPRRSGIQKIAYCRNHDLVGIKAQTRVINGANSSSHIVKEGIISVLYNQEGTISQITLRSDDDPFAPGMILAIDKKDY